MNNFKNEPMVKHSNQVHTTTDYFLFKPIDGNRNKNLLHINRLRKSMAQNYLFTVIIVNEKYEIIDGQHRFEVIQELKLPLHYIVCIGYGLNEVHILNANSKTWNADDYLEGYCKLGYTDYLIYADYKEKYRIGHNECIALLSNWSTANSDSIREFYEGKFKVKNLMLAEEYIEKILMIEPYYAGVRRRTFIGAMLQLFNNKNFQFTELLQKLKTQPTALQDCTSASNYKILIEEIYNYRRREKVNLRF
jgi:hypothetical protein